MDNLYRNRLLLLAIALKSDKYKQNTENVLRNSNGFSVNGVAVDLYSEITGNGRWNGYIFCDIDGTWGSSISDKTGSFFLNNTIPSNIHVGDCNLSDLHNNRKTFKEIAEIIERYLND